MQARACQPAKTPMTLPRPMAHGSTAAVALLVLLAGCVASPSPPAGDAAADEPREASFAVQLARGGGSIAGLVWTPAEGATTVVLALHTVGGTKDNEWHNAPLANYSLAEDVVARGRAFVAIDLPSYGASDGGEDTTLVDLRDAASQVADQLRAGGYGVSTGEAPTFERVVGVGYSMGGHVANLAQAQEARPFDAIATFGWSLSAADPQWEACVTGTPACTDERDPLLHAPNVEPEVWAFLNETHTEVSVPLFMQAVATTAGAPNGDGAPQARLAEGVAGPVLLVQGDEDWVWWDQAGDADRYPPTAEVEVVTLDDTGHFVLHHRTRLVAHDAFAAWLDRHDL